MTWWLRSVRNSLASSTPCLAERRQSTVRLSMPVWKSRSAWNSDPSPVSSWLFTPNMASRENRRIASSFTAGMLGVMGIDVLSGMARCFQTMPSGPVQRSHSRSSTPSPRRRGVNWKPAPAPRSERVRRSRPGVMARRSLPSRTASTQLGTAPRPNVSWKCAGPEPPAARTAGVSALKSSVLRLAPRPASSSTRPATSATQPALSSHSPGATAPRTSTRGAPSRAKTMARRVG